MDLVIVMRVEGFCARNYYTQCFQSRTCRKPYPERTEIRTTSYNNHNPPSSRHFVGKKSIRDAASRMRIVRLLISLI